MWIAMLTALAGEPTPECQRPPDGATAWQQVACGLSFPGACDAERLFATPIATLLTEHGPLIELAFGTARPDRVSSEPLRGWTR